MTKAKSKKQVYKISSTQIKLFQISDRLKQREKEGNRILSREHRTGLRAGREAAAD